jgi:hypothetical protein
MTTDALTYSMGQIVYLKLKPDVAGMVTGILFRPSGHGYYVTWSSDTAERYHFDCELTKEKSFAATEET